MRRHPVLLPVSAGLLLCACATEATFTKAGQKPDPVAFESDSHDCGKVGHSGRGVIASAFAGAGQMAYNSARDTSDPLSAAVGGAFGAVVGLFAGAFNLGDGDNFNLCMARKGYQMVDPEQAAAQSATPSLEHQEPHREPIALDAVPEL